MDFQGLFSQHGWEFLICFILISFAISFLSFLILILKFFVSLYLPINASKVQGRHILVIGASQGLGQEISIKVAQLGASRVTLSARGADQDNEGKSRLDYSVEECKANCPDVIIEGLKMDVLDPESVKDAMQNLLERTGKIDWIIISSGMCLPEMVLNDDKEYKPTNETKMININYIGAISVIKTIFHLCSTSGKSDFPERIITIGSVSSCCATAGFASYSASKAALKLYTDNLRNERFFYGDLKVHHFLPGPMDTPGFEIENQTKPEVTRKIEGTLETISATEAANSLLIGVTHETYLISSDILGFICSSNSSGVAPRSDPLLQLFGFPWIILVSEVFYRYFDSVSKSAAKSK